MGGERFVIRAGLEVGAAGAGPHLVQLRTHAMT